MFCCATLCSYNQAKDDPRSCEPNLCNCLKKPEKKFRTATGFEPVTLRYRCDVLTNWAMKPLTLGAGQLWARMYVSSFLSRWFYKSKGKNSVRNVHYYMATIVRALWLAAERARFLVMTGHYENFSRLDGSFELWVKATSAWAKTTKYMDKVQLYFQ